MATKALFNELVLAFAPICNYDFALLKEDAGFQEHLRSSKLYIIAQRPELTFEQLVARDADGGQVILEFDICQKGNASTLHCSMPIYQETCARDIDKDIQLHFMYALPKPDPMPKTFPQHGVRNLLLFYTDKTFIGWLSPEGFLQRYLQENILANVEGPIDHFLCYQVHYVGKATEQAIWKRLTGHSTLQEILSLEYPLQYGALPTHEIAVLFFKAQVDFGIFTIGRHDLVPSDIVETMAGSNLPSEKAISLDAEKALIQAMQPKYNKIFYDRYPEGKDSLSAYKLDSYSYRIHNHLILKYDNGEIRGRPDLFADAIVVKNGQPLKIIKQKQT